MECNGQSTSSYPELAAIVGEYVPDYRGVFLRGLGSTTSNHFGVSTHQSGHLGQLQGDAIRNITGSLPVNDNGGFPAPTGAFYFSYAYEYGPADEHDKYGGVYNFDASKVIPTANEIRPVNKAVIYLIKAK